MTFQYCENCEKKTGHKRAIGAGTVIGAFVTGGFSLLAIPAYPPRCIACGNAPRWEAMSRPIDSPMREYEGRSADDDDEDDDWKPLLKFLGLLGGGILGVMWTIQGIISLFSWLFPS